MKGAPEILTLLEVSILLFEKMHQLVAQDHLLTAKVVFGYLSKKLGIIFQLWVNILSFNSLRLSQGALPIYSKKYAQENVFGSSSTSLTKDMVFGNRREISGPKIIFSLTRYAFSETISRKLEQCLGENQLRYISRT